MAAIPPQTGAPPTAQDELTPAKLAALWKKQGGFDQLRKHILADFLASPDRDALLARLDALLPTVLASTPSLARQSRAARPATVLAELEKRDAIKEGMDKLEVRLRGKKREGRRIERELGRTLRRARGEEVGEEEDSEEEGEGEVKGEYPVPTAPPANPSTPASSAVPTLAPPTPAPAADSVPAPPPSASPAVPSPSLTTPAPAPPATPLEAGDSAIETVAEAALPADEAAVELPGKAEEANGDGDVEMQDAPPVVAEGEEQAADVKKEKE
ncbi:hypothetical protein JCM8097_002596 [Rhodosporidiobolus ruineniae]